MIGEFVTRALISQAEAGRLPDAWIRAGIRRLLRKRLEQECVGNPAAVATRTAAFEHALRSATVAVETAAANVQHYEAPTEFYRISLGPRMKYSGCLWSDGVVDLAGAELASLEQVAARARLVDGQDVLELGCGWGSFTLWAAETFPNSRFTGVSNSRTQREWIESEAIRRGLANVTVQTCDMNVFDPGRTFDRIVSIEMFEHMRNYEVLLSRIARWMRSQATLFIHVFCHRTAAYPFEVGGAADWMAREFFTGGLMPSADFIPRFRGELIHEATHLVGGEHYQKTAEAWLANTDARADAALAALSDGVKPSEAALRLQRRRIFYMACAELFGFAGGREWLVAHHVFRKA